MALEIDKRYEGLRELASMIAADYRRRTTGEVISPLNTSESNDGNRISEVEIIMRIEPSDSRPGFVYTEIIGVVNFTRNKKRLGRHKEINNRDSEGGQDVANKRNLRNRKAALPGQDKSGDQRGEG
jgi:hypothetical protein